MAGAKQTIVASSGFSSGTLSVLQKYWHVLDIQDHAEAVEYLRQARRLPLAVVIGYARSPGELDRLVSHSKVPINAMMPAYVALRHIQAIDPDLPVIISTSNASPTMIVDLIKRGAFDYVVEPVGSPVAEAWDQYASEFTHALHQAVRWRETLLENRRLREQLATRAASSPPVISRSAGMLLVCQLIDKVAPTPATVLVTGASGTGKEVVARQIHARSPRSRDPFLAINCASLPETLLGSELFGHVRGAFTGADRDAPGLIRQAGSGTILLDELQAVSPAFQVALLRVLEQRVARALGGRGEYAVTCRFVAAANRDLAELVRQGSFREDLYYRLNVFHVHLPPLRQRSEDIPALAEHFFAQISREYGKPIRGISPRAMSLLEESPWPGNVRQLRNAVERAVILCEGPELQERDFAASILAAEPVTASAPRDYRGQMEQFEAGLLRTALDRSGGSVSAAARSLMMRRTTLHGRLRRLGLQPG